MKLKFTTWFSIFALFVTLASCEDHRIPSPSGQRFRIKQIAQKVGNNSPTYSRFYYNDKVRLDSIVTGYGSKKQMYYDDQGKLTKIERQVLSSGPAGSSPLEFAADKRYYYYYDKAGNISSVYTEQVSDVLKFAKFAGQWDFEYDANNKAPVKVTSITGGPVSSGRAHYSYGYYSYSGGNVIKTNNTSINYQYDDKPNLLYGLVYGAPANELIDQFDDIRTFSKNNVLLSHEVYSYDNNGLLIKAAQRDGNYEITYEYEAY